MTSKLLTFTIPISLLFYCVIPLLYLFPRIAQNKASATVMLTVAFVVVAPTLAALVARLCRLGLRAGGISRGLAHLC